ncbi:cytochrome-c peroxidase [Myxococcus sp. K38C18041901]|uniref:cytochrome-c peroxidase n=1 Tax=Myxococcus guangdongensis TaxID=2906760 RepID=UPI0020A7EA3A|nr:cytochrome c peroxidase [Myxococcus guangdongensis]MCP3062724.1 cytochrome-c peroxidase [Myxococcus guangdongensis]
MAKKDDPVMISRSWRAAALALSLGGLGLACESEEPFPTLDELDQLRSLHSLSSHARLDATNRVDGLEAARTLGNELFRDPGLSRCGSVSCESCHTGEGRTVETPTAEGCGGQRTERNPPTVLNVRHNRWFMWDGRADSLWSQAILPLTNPVEMDSDAEVVRARLQAQDSYRSRYLALFGADPGAEPGPELMANVGKVLAAYERDLMRVEAPFDVDVRRFLAAVDAGTAESDPAYLGLKTFVRKGQCIVCHKGPSLTDELFHNVGLQDKGPGAGGQWAVLQSLLDWEYNAAGRYSDDRSGADARRLTTLRTQAKQEELEGAFRTPSLRNVALTAPYMHTGAQATLEEVVDFYNEGGDAEGTFTGKRTVSIAALDLTNEEKRALVELLKSLTGATR